MIDVSSTDKGFYNTEGNKSWLLDSL